jgi:hypothetical protein
MRASTFLMAVALLNSASAWAQVTIRSAKRNDLKTLSSPLAENEIGLPKT